MLHRSLVAVVTAVVIGVAYPPAAAAQGTPTTPAAPARARAASGQSRGWHLGGFATVGNLTFTAQDSFDAILGTHAGPVYGGGVRVGLPWGGLFAEVSASRFRDTGGRVFVFNGTPIPLGISTTVTVTPVDASVGWQFRLRRMPRVTPYVAGGYTSLRYEETSAFATGSENVKQNNGGYHLFGGVEYKVARWLGAAGEVAWASVPKALGADGVSKSFREDNLGGTTVRLKITIGR